MFIHFPNDLAKNVAIATASFGFWFFPLCVYVCMYVFPLFLKFFFCGSLNMKFGPNDILS